VTIYDLKPAFQNLLRPIVRKIHAAGKTPNQVTLFTCACSIAFGLFLFHSDAHWFALFPLFLFVRMALNAIDGMLAKEHDMKTPLGAIYNEVTDVVSDGFLYYAFIKFTFIKTDLLFFVIFFAAVTEITGLAVLQNGRPREYAGPMGKSDRAFVFSLMAILIATGIDNYRLYNGILALVALLLLVTVFNRAKKSLRENP
jgi:CDP-diacylglycerol--glycerol-3-phosphate 3-phosphatidyltransferase